MLTNRFETPEAIEIAFYEALENADINALMSLWSEEDEIVCVLPGGARLVGHEAIRAAWQETFSHGSVQVHPTGAHEFQGLLATLHSVIEEVTLSVDGKTAVVSLIASNVFFKSPRGWRLVLHHASPAPAAPSGDATETHVPHRRVTDYLH